MGNRATRSPVAIGIPFDPDTTPLTSDNVQEAIEEISNKQTVDITQTAHGFTLPSYGVLPLYYNNVAGEYQLANANMTNTASDVLAVGFPDANTITIQETGILEITHGLTVGKWYVLDDTVAGTLVALDTVTGSEANIQYLAFALDATRLILRPDPIFTQDLFVPQDIDILEDWVQGSMPTLTAGDDRMLLAGVILEEQGGGSTTVSGMSIGGQAGTLVVEQTILSGIQAAASMYRWTDAQIELMANNTLTVTWTAGAPDFFQEFGAILEHVEQALPIQQVNTDSGTGGTDTLDADVNSTTGGYVVQIAAGGNPFMGFTNNGTGWTRKLDVTITSADGVVDDKLITATATPENVNMTVTASNRHVLIAASILRRET